MEKLIEKIPNWARWILVPFSSPLFFAIPETARYFFVEFLKPLWVWQDKLYEWQKSWMSWLPLFNFYDPSPQYIHLTEGVSRFIFVVVSSVVAGFLGVYGAVLMAPRYKRRVSTIFGIFYLLYALTFVELIGILQSVLLVIGCWLAISEVDESR